MRRHTEAVLGGAAAAIVGAAGIYELVDRQREAADAGAGRARCRPSSTSSRASQVVTDNGVEVLVPPLHHQRSSPARSRRGRPREGARARSSRRFATLEAQYEPTPAGLGVTVAWGLPTSVGTFRAGAQLLARRSSVRSPYVRAARRDPLPERPG